MRNSQLRETVKMARQNLNSIYDLLEVIEGKIQEHVKTSDRDPLQDHVLQDAQNEVMNLKAALHNLWETL